MTPAELLTRHGIKADSAEPGRHYTTCPKCSAGRKLGNQNKKSLGITIDDKSTHWGCNHCGWTGPEKGTGNGRDGSDLITYDYRDAGGIVRFQKVRAYDKDGKKLFWMRRPDGRGGWVKGTEGANTKLVYRLPEVIKALDRTIFVVEGEKDVDALWAIGVPATCNAHGASEPDKKPKWQRAHSEALRGADIVIIPDNDAQGRAHAEAAASLSQGIAKRVRMLDLAEHWPVIPNGGDISNWLAAGHNHEELEALIEKLPDWLPQPEPEPEPAPPVEATAPQFSDEALALLFSARHANDLRYVAPWNKWLRYDGKRWEFEVTLQTFDAARKLCRELAAQCEKKGTAKAIASAKTVAAVVTLSRADRRQAATTAQWDRDTWLLGTPDGTIDLRTGKLQPPKLDNYITKIVSITPGGDCPQWMDFLDLVTNHDIELQSYLQRVCGYCLTGVTSEHQFFFYYGKGANGKSAYLNTVSGILGDYHRTASMEMFTVTKMERHPTDLAMLRGARLVTAVETEEGKRWDESKLKALTGGDPVAARFMRQDFFEYVPQFKFMIAGNHKPTIRNVDEAIRRRLRLIPFLVTIPESKRILNFAEKVLAAERPGILRWMIEGCLAWERDGLKAPNVVTAATESYVESQDDLQAFIDQCCVVGAKEWDTVEHLWNGWLDWAQDCNEFIGSKRRFGDRLADKGYERTTGGADKTRMFKRICCVRENAKKQAAEARKRADEARTAREPEFDKWGS